MYNKLEISKMNDNAREHLISRINRESQDLLANRGEDYISEIPIK